jgi:hypothetical protein
MYTGHIGVVWYNQRFIMYRETMYVAPEVEIYEVLAEGVLCNSPMEGVGEEDGNGGFA